MSVRVVTDSVSNIPADLLEKYDIEVASLYIIENGVSTREVDMDFEDFYDRLEKMEQPPTSAQPSPDDFLQLFNRLLDEGHEIVGVFISELMSGTIANAYMVRDMILAKRPEAKIEIVDSRSNSMSEGFAALAAAEAASAGAAIEECVHAAVESVKRTRFLFTVQTLEYLRRGGRIGSAAALLGSLLQLTPVLTTEDGVAATFKKVRTYHKAIDTIVEQCVVDAETHGGLNRLIVHSIAQFDKAKEVRDQLAEKFSHLEIPIISLSPVIGTHVGPAVGVIYETVEPLRA